MLEFAVAFVALMALTIGMMDMARLFSIQMLLNKGAQDAATLASKMANIDNDFRNLPPSSHHYQWYIDARRRILTEATRIPTETWLTDENTPSAAYLLPVTMIDDALDLTGIPAPVYTRGAGLIRPGERVWFGDPAAVGDTSKGFWANHNKVPYTMPKTVQRPRSLMLYHPIQVEMAARVDMFFPGIDSKTVRGLGLAFREPNIPQSPLAPLPGEPAVTTTTTTTSTSSSTTARSTTTTTMWACTPNWGLAFSDSGTTEDPQCPVSGPGPICGTADCSDSSANIRH